MDQKQAIQKRTDEIKDLFSQEGIVKRICDALPRHITKDKFLRIALNSILGNEDLMKCSNRSLLTSVLNCAVLGLSTEKYLGQAAIVPYKGQASLIPMYRGYIRLGRNSGDISDVDADVVCENDEFSIVQGTEGKQLVHKPNVKERGEPIGAYAIFFHPGGRQPSFRYMTKEEIEARRKVSKVPNSLMWQDFWGEGGKKTAIRNLAKLCDMSPEFMKAVELENRFEVGELQPDLMGDVIDIPSEETPTSPTTIGELAESRGEPSELVEKFIELMAEKHKMTSDQVLADAINDGAGFWAAFQNWKKAQAKPKEEAPPTEPPKAAVTTPMWMADQQIEAFQIFSGFRKSESIIAFAKQNAEDIETYPDSLRNHFDRKWQALVGTKYPAVPATPAPTFALVTPETAEAAWAERTKGMDDTWHEAASGVLAKLCQGQNVDPPFIMVDILNGKPEDWIDSKRFYGMVRVFQKGGEKV